MIEQKLEALRSLLRSLQSTVIAYSGGVDSVFLAYCAHEVLADRSLAVIADSPSLPRRELTEAVAVASTWGFPLRVINTAEFSNADYTSNPLNRCYFCKHELFTELVPLAKELGFAVVAYGENASDTGDFRPGAQAAGELQIRAPLKEVGLTKSEIRELSARLGLPTSDKPEMACLSSRVPHGEAVTERKLHMIEAAENFLRDQGFCDVRVRHHEMPAPQAIAQPASSSSRTNLAAPAVAPAFARIEIGNRELPRLADPALCSRIADELKRIGYLHVTLDLHGYRRGGANDLTRPAGA